MEEYFAQVILAEKPQYPSGLSASIYCISKICKIIEKFKFGELFKAHLYLHYRVVI